MLNQNVRFLYGRSQNNYLDTFLCQCNGSNWCSDHYAYAAGQVPCTKVFAFCAWDPPSTNLRPLQDLVRLFSGSACSEIRDRVYGLLSMALEWDAFEVDYAISTTELFVRTLSVARPTHSSDATNLQYLSELVNGLGLSDFDLREENIRPLKERYALKGWSFEMELDPFAVFANSRFRQTTWMNVSPRLETDRTADRLLNMTAYGARKAKSRSTSDEEEISYTEGIPNLDVSGASLRRTIVAGNSCLLSGDVILKIASHSMLSNLFLVGRLCEHKKFELEIVAVAESDRPVQTFRGGPAFVDNDSRIKFKIFDAPKCVNGTSITLKVKKISQNTSWELRWPLTSHRSLYLFNCYRQDRATVKNKCGPGELRKCL